MTCKDCLHADVCKAFLDRAGYKETIIGENADKRCQLFADKSRFVELPCKIGDTVYKINSHVWRSECGMCEHYIPGAFGDICECGKTYDGTKAPECRTISDMVVSLKDILWYVAFGDFGKTVFLTREEAEAAIKEKNHEDNRC